MTYCAAFKLGNQIMMLSDSAVTSQQELEAVESVFGEPHINQPDRKVEDGVKKIFKVSGDLMTFAGSYQYGIVIARKYEEYKSQGNPPSTALELAIISSQPAPAGHACSILLSCKENDDVKLFVGKTSPEVEIVECVDFISIGADANLRKLFDGRLKKVVGQFTSNLTVSNRLALLSATCSGVSISRYTLDQGVGGAFYSAAFTSEGVEWLEDTVIFIYELEQSGKWPQVKAAVALGVRNDVFVTRKKIGEATTTSGQFIGGSVPSIESLKVAVKDAQEKTLRSVKEGKFAYFCFINYRNDYVHVVEMNRQLKHSDLIVKPPKVYTGMVNYGFTLSPELRGAMENDVAEQTMFRPFKRYPAEGHMALKRGIAPGNISVI